MANAYALAVKAKELGEVPVGAVLVSADNKLLAQAFNQVLQTNDPCAHAEILVLRAASLRLNNHRLLNTSLYSTLEPCAMCAGALVQARIKRLIFASRDFKAGAAGSVYNLLRGYPLNHQIQIDEGIMQKECSLLLGEFFARLR